jgi:GT2 family glycosyltransferase
MKIAIIILAHNAIGYVYKALCSLRRQQLVDYDIILVDNGSSTMNGIVLAAYARLFSVRSFVRSATNRFFSGGMNFGAQQVRPEATHLLLLNSDVEFQHPRALETFCRTHLRGATGLRAINDNPVMIADGFCFLVDRDLFEALGGLDERFPWTRAITKLQAELLRSGYIVQAVREYQSILVHYGGKSGTDWKGVHKKVELAEVSRWFEGLPPVTVVPQLRSS